MQITFFSIMMALFWTSLAVGVIYFLRRVENRIFPVSLFLGLCIASVARMCLPFEFPFTRPVSTPHLYNWLFPFFMQDIPHLSISPWELIMLLCVIISICFLLHLIYLYYVTNRYIMKMYHEQSHQLVTQIQTKYPEFGNLQYVIVNKNFRTPMQLGIARPIILLPDMEYEENEFYYIIKHEMTHYKNRDTWVKLAVNIWKCLFWWFPLAQLFSRELDESLELKCDRVATKDMSRNQKAEYLNALLHVCEAQEKKFKHKQELSYATAFHLYNSKESIICRFHYIIQKPGKDIYACIIAGFLGCMLMASYLWVFQPYEQPQYNKDDGSIYFSQEESYIYHTVDNTYELYINGELTAVLNEDTVQNMIKTGITCIEEQD